MKKEYTLPSTDGKNTLHVAAWEPEGAYKAIVQISHGMIEYIERYDEFARFLNDNNILVIGSDHLGHGHTAACDEDLGYIGEGLSKSMVDDLKAVTDFAVEKYEKVPVILFGHSMGSFLARRYIAEYGSGLAGAVICGSGFMPAAVIGAGKRIISIFEKVKGERYRSEFLKKTIFGGYNKRIENVKTPNDWLSRNEENVAKYNADKYCTYAFTVNGYKALMDVYGFIQNEQNVKRIPAELPLFLIAGEADPVGNYGEGVKALKSQYDRLGLKDVELKLYPEDRHEILNEIDRREVFADVLGWIDRVLA